jgi:hypothetical protein
MIKRIRAAFAACFVAGTIVAATPASAVPGICVMPTSGTVSGLALVIDINNCFGTALGLFAGGSAPGSQTTGMLWWNTSTGYVAQWDGAAWNNLWNVDATNHLNAVQIGGGVQASLASASVIDLWSVPAASVAVTGSTMITQLANGLAVPGTIKIVTFAGALTLTQGGGSGGTPLNLPNGGNNIVTAAGDYAIVLALTATNVQVIHYERATGAALSTVGLSVGASALGASALGSFQQPANMAITTSVSSFNLTIGVLGQNQAAISASNPVLVNFRSQALTTSGYNVFANITSPLASFVISSGSTMGCVSGVLCRLWIELICQTESPSGIGCSQVLIGASVQSSTTTCAPLQEDALQSTGAGSSGGSAVGTIYSTVGGLSGKAIRIVGYIEDTWTSGTGWGSPTKIQLFGAGVHKPCDLVQTVFASFSATGSATSGSTMVSSGITVNITPTSAVNLVKVDAMGTGSVPANSAPVVLSAQIDRTVGATTTAISQFAQFGGQNSTYATNGSVAFGGIIDAPSTTAAANYAIYFNTSTPGHATSLPAGSITAQEIMGALDLEKILPANDNGAPLRLVG